MRALVLCALVACTYPEKQLAPDFLCSGQPPPMKSDSVVTVSGAVIHAFPPTPLASSTVVVMVRGMSQPLAMQVTDSNGLFSISVDPPSGVIYDAYLHATPPSSGMYASDLPANAYPAAPLAHGVTVAVELFDQMTIDGIYANSLLTQNAGTANVLVVVDDCDGFPIAGAKVNAFVDGAMVGTALYFDGVKFSNMQTKTNATGVAWLANVTAPTMSNTVTINGTADGYNLTPRTVDFITNGVIQTALAP